jgi:hypothetical protein
VGHSFLWRFFCYTTFLIILVCFIYFRVIKTKLKRVRAISWRMIGYGHRHWKATTHLYLAWLFRSCRGPWGPRVTCTHTDSRIGRTDETSHRRILRCTRSPPSTCRDQRLLTSHAHEVLSPLPFSHHRPLPCAFPMACVQLTLVNRVWKLFLLLFLHIRPIRNIKLLDTEHHFEGFYHCQLVALCVFPVSYNMLGHAICHKLIVLVR